MFAIRALGPAPRRYRESMQRLIEIQTLAKPFMVKLWNYNVTARQEIDCHFEDDLFYRQKMQEQFSAIATILEEIKEDIPVSTTPLSGSNC
jgi:hypothetical protein